MGGALRAAQSRNREGGDLFGDGGRTLRTVGTEPVGGPVERAEERARRDRRVGVLELAAPDAVADEGTHAAFVAVALGDDGRAHPGRQRRHFQVRGRSLDLVDQTEDMGDGEVVQSIGERPADAPRRGERLEQLVERLILAEEEELVLAAEVVIQVAGREVGRDGDVAHAGRGEAVRAERPRGGPEDLDAPRVGAPQADRTAVRKLNHRSILARSPRFLNISREMALPRTDRCRRAVSQPTVPGPADIEVQ